MTPKKRRSLVWYTNPRDLEPELTIEEQMLSDTSTPSFDEGIPSVVEYSDRHPEEYVITGTLGAEKPEGSLRRHFSSLEAVELWARIKFGARARLSTKCRVLKTAVRQGRVSMKHWQLWVRKPESL
jgi:hypothetical protein